MPGCNTKRDDQSLAGVALRGRRLEDAAVGAGFEARGRLWLICVLACLGVAMGGSRSVEAQAQGQVDGGLTAVEAEAGFGWVEDWVRRGEAVPEDAALPGTQVVGVFGACVTLRADGRVLGRGEAVREDVAAAIGGGGPAVRLAGLLAKATREALAEMRSKQMRRAVDLGINDPDLFDRGFRAARQQVQIDVQIGYGLTSIVLPLEEEQLAVFSQYAPGYHGLRLVGPIAEGGSLAWPATERSRNTSPPRTLFRLLEAQGYDAEDLELVARGDGPRLQRFDAMHLVRTGPDAPLRMLTRGDLVLDRQVIDGRTIAGLAERSARYLDRLVLEEPAGSGRYVVRGSYRPASGRYAPPWADGREAALLSYAMTRHARVAIEAGLAEQAARTRAERGLALALQLLPSASPDAGPMQHLTAAFVLLTLCETPGRLLPEQLVLRDRLGQRLMDLRHPGGGGYRVAADSDTRLSRSSASVVTAALASWHRRTRSKTIAPTVWAVMNELVQVNREAPDPVDWYWIAHALQQGEVLAKDVAASDREMDAADTAKTLGDWRSAQADYLAVLSDAQIRTRPTLGPDDVLGGFVLQDARPGSPPNPTWDSALPLGLVAFALREPTVVPENQVTAPLLTAELGARFLGQLMITETLAYDLRNPAPAIGGTRSTLWDSTLSPDASAMTLLALAELQRSLSALEAQLKP